MAQDFVNLLAKSAKHFNYIWHLIPFKVSPMLSLILNTIDSLGARTRAKQLALGLAMGVALMGSAQGQVILFDFGPTEPSGGNLTNSPAHSTGVISASANNWNIIGVTDVLTGLEYADGSSATGIALYTGAETSATSKVIDFAATLSSSNALGSEIDSGVYAGNSVGTDGVWQATNGVATGIQVTGLSAGTYEIYITGRNTNQSGGVGPASNYYVSASAPGTTFNFDGLTLYSSANTTTASWVAGENYQVFTVTLGTGQVLNIANDGDGSSGGGGRGFLNSLQIVTIPEPGASGLALLAVSGFLLFRRRRSRHLS